MTWWLARDYFGSSPYLLATQKMRLVDTLWTAPTRSSWWYYSSHDWHALGGVRLKPGAGPVKVVPPLGKWRRA